MGLLSYTYILSQALVDRQRDANSKMKNFELKKPLLDFITKLKRGF